MLKDHYNSSLKPNLADEQVKLAGFVHSRRDHGKIIFIDLRDSTGLVQLIFSPDNDKAYKKADKLSVEDVVCIKGTVKKRPKGMVNKEIVSGEVEVEVKDLKILSRAKTPPFEVGKNTKNVSEEKRLKKRYIDLRSPRMQKNLEVKDKVFTFARSFFKKEGFREVETPYLTKGTPEGAREYVVPSRLHKGEFYVLPQSPQQFKQLLMVSGIERYYQIARCFRDEDPRADRQQEFTQLDMEMSFVSQEDIMRIIEQWLSEMIEEKFPDRKITQTPFPRMSYKKAMKEYQTDAPDIRENTNDPNELGFCWVTDFPLLEWNGKDEDLKSTHHPFTMPKEEDIDKLDSTPEKVLSQAYDIVLNGYEIGGGSIRITDSNLQKKIFNILGMEDKEIEERFGHMLEAFKYGVPPHGGIASGLDRLIAVLAKEENIREVIAFPKTGDGRDLMMKAPASIKKEQLKELGIKIKKDKKEE